jgi:hypothetical protein
MPVPLLLSFDEYANLDNPYSFICDWEIAHARQKNLSIHFSEPYSRSVSYDHVSIIAALVSEIQRSQLRHLPEVEFRNGKFNVIDGCHRLRAFKYLRVRFIYCLIEIIKFTTFPSMEESAFQNVKKKVTDRVSGWNLKWSTQEGDVVEELIKQYEAKNQPKVETKQLDYFEVTCIVFFP